MRLNSVVGRDASLETRIGFEPMCVGLQPTASPLGHLVVWRACGESNSISKAWKARVTPRAQAQYKRLTSTSKRILNSRIENGSGVGKCSHFTPKVYETPWPLCSPLYGTPGESQTPGLSVRSGTLCSLSYKGIWRTIGVLIPARLGESQPATPAASWFIVSGRSPYYRVIPKTDRPKP